MQKFDYQTDMPAAEDLLSIYALLSKSITRAIRQKTHFTPSMMLALLVIEWNGTMTMSEIGAKMEMSKSNICTLIDDLVAKKMLERLFDANDRRIIKICLTEKGKTALKNIKQAVSEELQQRVTVLEPEKLVELREDLTKVRAILKEMMA